MPKPAEQVTENLWGADNSPPFFLYNKTTIATKQQ